MTYPKHDCIVEIKTEKRPSWSFALFYWNGNRPVFAQYGSEITDNVIEWRSRFPHANTNIDNEIDEVTW